MSARMPRADYSRFVIVRDRDGVRHALARGAISVLRETEDGETILLLAGGRMLYMPEGLEATLAQIGAEPLRYDPRRGDSSPRSRAPLDPA